MRAYGVKMNVMDYTKEGGRILHQQRLVATLEKVPVLFAETIESGGEGTLQPVHTFDQVRLRGFERQMEVVAHDRIRVDAPVVADARLGKRGLEGCRSSTGLEDSTPVVPPIDHVVQRSLVLDSRHSGHDRINSGNSLRAPRLAVPKSRVKTSQTNQAAYQNTERPDPVGMGSGRSVF